VSHRSLSCILGALAALIVGMVAGCAGEQTKANSEEDAKPTDSASGDDKGKGDKGDKADAKSDKAEPSEKWNDKSEGRPKPDELNDAQREQMEIALRRGGDKVSNCDKVVPGTPTGEGEVKVTFDGKKGRAVDVGVPAPWAGTPAEQCIKRAFVGEIIVPFDGELEVPYGIKIGGKADAKGDKAGKVGKPIKKK
jgi:hypothetical protein